MSHLSHARPLAALALALLSLSAHAAGAQAATETGFHAGQNALEANVSSVQPGITFAHFTTPSRALVARVQGALNGRKVELTDPTYTIDGEGSKYGGRVELDLGLRTYRPISHGVAALYEFGALSRYIHSPGDDSHYVGAGVYGELGGQYALAPNLSVGVTTGLAATYLRERYQKIVKVRYLDVGTENTRAVVTFYF